MKDESIPTNKCLIFLISWQFSL